MTEEWRPVVDYEGQYEVSSIGRVRSIDRHVTAVREGIETTWLYRGRNLKIQFAKHGDYTWPQVNLSGGFHGRGCSTRRISRLVAEAFLGPRPEGYHVAHIDGDPANNRVDNIRYATPAENNSDKKVHGTQTRGGRHQTAKLTDRQYAEIVRRIPHQKYKSLAKEFGVHPTWISKIANGKGRI